MALGGRDFLKKHLVFFFFGFLKSLLDKARALLVKRTFNEVSYEVMKCEISRDRLL